MTPVIAEAYGAQDVSDVTRLLDAVERGEPQAAEELLPLVYQELRRLAAAGSEARERLYRREVRHRLWRPRKAESALWDDGFPMFPCPHCPFSEKGFFRYPPKVEDGFS